VLRTERIIKARQGVPVRFPPCLLFLVQCIVGLILRVLVLVGRLEMGHACTSPLTSSVYRITDHLQLDRNDDIQQMLGVSEDAWVREIVWVDPIAKITSTVSINMSLSEYVYVLVSSLPPPTSKGNLHKKLHCSRFPSFCGAARSRKTDNASNSSRTHATPPPLTHQPPRYSPNAHTSRPRPPAYHHTHHPRAQANHSVNQCRGY
jgi:hypothetical protein